VSPIASALSRASSYIPAWFVVGAADPCLRATWRAAACASPLSRASRAAAAAAATRRAAAPRRSALSALTLSRELSARPARRSGGSVAPAAPWASRAPSSAVHRLR